MSSLENKHVNREMFVAIAVGVAVFAGMAHGDVRPNPASANSHFAWARQAWKLTFSAKTALKPFTRFTSHLEGWR